MPFNSESLLRFIHRVAATEGDSTDEGLLGRFLAYGDEVAFTALVRRHGPMVLRVCQRVLGNSHDAEDAFQATFLVLARKVRSVGPPQLLPNWLYGVAYRTALKARGQRLRRQIVEKRAEPTQGEASEDPAWSDLRPVLDEEICRLPQKYRVTFVLCYLEGRTNQEAAALLSCPKGTVLSRLAWARERLRSRLSRRGIALTTLLFLSLSSEVVFSTSLTASTAKDALAFAAGREVAPKVAFLAKGVIQTMLMSKVRIAALALVVVLAVAFAGVQRHFALAEPEAQAPAAVDRSVPFLRAKVSSDEILDVTGLNIYKFQLDIPKGEKFKVMLSRTESKDAEAKVLFHFDFTKEKEGPVTLLVSFLRLDRKMEGVLLSEEKLAAFGLRCDGCRPPGLGTIVTNPLTDIPGPEKLLVVNRSDKDSESTKKGPTRLITIMQTKDEYPRGELSVTRVP